MIDNVKSYALQWSLLRVYALETRNLVSRCT